MAKRITLFIAITTGIVMPLLALANTPEEGAPVAATEAIAEAQPASPQARAAKNVESAKLEVLSFVDEAFLRTKPKLNWGRDPFYRTPGFLRGQPVRNDTLTLTAIIFNRMKQAALINGQVVRKGTILENGAVVTDIQPNYVLVQDGSSLRELTLPEPDDVNREQDPKQNKLEKLLQPEEPAQGKEGEVE